MKYLKTISIGLATLSIVIYLAADGTNQRPHKGPLVKRVQVASIENTTEISDLRFSGVTRAAQRAKLAFALGGRLISRPAEIGQQVKKGQLLAKLDDREPLNGVATARNTLAEITARQAQTERDLKRTEQLVAAKAATSEELEKNTAAAAALKAGENAARARLQDAQRLLSETRLSAPFSGTITEVLYEPGEFVVAGRPAVVLSGDGEVELEVEVPESIVPRIAVGDTAQVTLPALGMPELEGKIKSVGRTALGAGRLFPVVVTLPQKQSSLAGVTAELTLRLVEENALSLPVEAVVNPGGNRPVVYRVIADPEGSKVEKVEVEIGTLLGDHVTVRGRLKTGDRVVIGGQRGLLDGERVEVEP